MMTVFNELFFSSLEDLQTDLELKKLQFGLYHRCNITVNICVPLPTSLRVPCGKVNGPEMHGNTRSNPMTLNIFLCCCCWFFLNDLVPSNFCFIFPFDFVTQACFIFLLSISLLLMCLSFYDYLKYWTYSLLQQNYLV